MEENMFMNLQNLTPEELAALKAELKASEYVKYTWTTDPKKSIPIKLYAEYINPMYKHLKSAAIIEKTSEKGHRFCKAEFVLEGGTVIEYDLTYNKHSFHKGEDLDIESLVFCQEVCCDKKHYYVTGNIF